MTIPITGGHSFGSCGKITGRRRNRLRHRSKYIVFNGGQSVPSAVAGRLPYAARRRKRVRTATPATSISTAPSGNKEDGSGTVVIVV